MLFNFTLIGVGITWALHHYQECAMLEDKPKEIMVGCVFCNLFLELFVVMTMYCVFDPAGRSWVKMKKYQRSMKEAESRFNYRRSGSTNRNWRQRKVIRAYQDSWNQRCRFFFCCLNTSDRNRNSFTDIAKLLSDFFVSFIPREFLELAILIYLFLYSVISMWCPRMSSLALFCLENSKSSKEKRLHVRWDPSHRCYQFFSRGQFYLLSYPHRNETESLNIYQECQSPRKHNFSPSTTQTTMSSFRMSYITCIMQLALTAGRCTWSPTRQRACATCVPISTASYVEGVTRLKSLRTTVWVATLQLWSKCCRKAMSNWFMWRIM